MDPSSRNAKSTKTRIETLVGCDMYPIAIRRNAKSTKTRIETFSLFLVQHLFPRVAMRNPLKQGLKPLILIFISSPLLVAMRNPLKQGLKLGKWVRLAGSANRRNAKSTKTRIETRLILTYRDGGGQSQCEIH